MKRPILRGSALLLTLCLIYSVLPLSTSSVEAAAISPPISKYNVSPTSGRPGQEYDLIITSTKNDCSTTNELSQAKLIAPQGVDLTVIEPSTKSPCALTARVKISETAAIGKVTMWVGKEKETPLGTIEFEIIGTVPAGSIPPGLNPPQVDIMWSVMPRSIVDDNFGKAMAKRYYGIEIIIGNNSAYTLQLVSVGFELPTDNHLIGLVARNQYNRELRKNPQTAPTLKPQMEANLKLMLDNPADPGLSVKKTLLPSSSYKITRGTLESKQLTHARTLVLSTITALGPIFTGFTPYFHNVNHRSNFSEAINIFSNPLEKGLELVWPDQKPRQKERFDDQVLRDGLIIRNNTQVRTLAFFPKELLRLPSDIENSELYDSWKDNAREIRERLGQLVIIGDQIQYVNRISLTPNPAGPITPPPSAYGISPNTIKQGSTSSVTITGANLQGAHLTVSGGAAIHIKKQEVDATGRVLTVEIEVDKTVAPGVYRLIVATPSSVASEGVSLFVEPEAIQVPDALQYEQKTAGNTVPIKATGLYLHNAHFRMAAGAGDKIKVVTKNRGADGKLLEGEVVTNDDAAAKTYKIEIYDESNPSKVITKDFVVKAP